MPKRHRWLCRSLGALVALVSIAGAVYGWAWVSVDQSSIARAMWWMEADVDDQDRFPARPIPTGDDPSRLPSGTGLDPSVTISATGRALDTFLRDTETLAFVVVHDDRMV